MAVTSLIYGKKVAKCMVYGYNKSFPYNANGFEYLTNSFRISNATSLCLRKYSTPFQENQDENTTRKNNQGTRGTKNSGPKITLIGNDNNMIVTSLQEAQKLSQRRDLKLVKMVDFDTKTQRAVYKLMTGSEFFEEDRKQRLLKAAKKEGSIKGEKMVTVSHRISEHDLQSRIKNIIRWLGKSYEARVVINGETSDTASSEKIYKLIEDAMKDHGRIVQKRQKGTDIRFQIIPPKKEKEQINTEETEPSKEPVGSR